MKALPDSGERIRSPSFRNEFISIRGFNDNITDRNIAIYGSFNKYFSKQSEETAMLNTRIEMNSFLNDGDLMRSPESGKAFMAYLRDGLTTAAIPSDQRAREVITQTVRDAIQKG